MTPPYKIRRSKRSRRIHLSIKNEYVEIVLPLRAPEHEGLSFFHKNLKWVEKHFKLANPSQSMEAEKQLPRSIQLMSINCEFNVAYQLSAESRKIHFLKENNSWYLKGNVENKNLCFSVLKIKLHEIAKDSLTQMIRKLSHEFQLPFNQLSFRSQKTIWGSCSRHKNINLNYKLIFLPYPLVRYVLLHELCHTIHLNHSKRFWKLLNQFEPNAHILRKELKKSEHLVPHWF